MALLKNQKEALRKEVLSQIQHDVDQRVDAEVQKRISENLE